MWATVAATESGICFLFVLWTRPKLSSNVFCCLTGFARTHPQTKSMLDLAQSFDQVDRLARGDRFAVDRFLTLPHQRFQLVSIDSRTLRDPFCYFRARTVVVDTGMTSEHAADACVDVFDSEVKG